MPARERVGCGQGQPSGERRYETSGDPLGSAVGLTDPRSDSLRSVTLRIIEDERSDQRDAARARSVAPRTGASRRNALGAFGAAAAFVAAGWPSVALASDSLELIPDYALFGLIKLGLIPDESGLGALWVMLIAFALLVFPLNALIFQPIFRALDARAQRIQGARSRSEHLQREADSILARYEEAVREARSDSEAARQAELARARDEQTALTSQAKQDAERQIENARAELARSLDQARATLRAGVDDLARSAAERVLGRSL